MKRFVFRNGVAVAIIGAMLALTACSGNNKPAAESSTPPTSSLPAATTAESPTPTPRPDITFTMNTDNPLLNWDNEVAKELTKRTGATIKWDVITGDFREKMNVWLAAGDYPEVVSIHDNTLTSYIKANAVLDLTDLIQKYAPNIMKAYNNDLTILKQPDGKIYGLLPPPTESIKNLNSQGWIGIQAEVLKDANYPPIHSLDDIYNIVKNYIAKYPKIGDGNTIGFSNFGAANQLFNTFDTAARAYAGLPALGLYNVDEQNNARLRFFEPGYTEAFKFFNKINAEGLFDPESLIQTPEQFDNKCNQGRVLVIFGNAGYHGCNSSLAKNGMPERSQIWFDVIAPDHTKVYVKPTLTANRGSDMWVAITEKAKDPKRIIEFFDDMYKLENQILVGWGLEGKYYTVENGKRVMTDWFIKELNSSDDAWERLGVSYGRPLMQMMTNGSTLSDGDYSKFTSSESYVASNLTPEIKEVLAKYNAKTYADLLAPGTERDIPFNATIAQWTDEIKKFNTDAIAEWGKAVNKFILEKDASKLDGIWNDLQNKLKDAGLDKQNQQVTEIYQNSLK